MPSHSCSSMERLSTLNATRQESKPCLFLWKHRKICHIQLLQVFPKTLCFLHLLDHFAFFVTEMISVLITISVYLQYTSSSEDTITPPALTSLTRPCHSVSGLVGNLWAGSK